MKSPGLNFDLMDQLTFYGSYHSRPGNQAIHFVFVPLIHWTITVWLAYAPLPTAYDLPAHMDCLPGWLSRYSALLCLQNGGSQCTGACRMYGALHSAMSCSRLLDNSATVWSLVAEPRQVPVSEC